LIAAVEEAEAIGAEGSQLDFYREMAAAGLAELRSEIETWGSGDLDSW
jgi:hypothetical protein